MSESEAVALEQESEEQALPPGKKLSLSFSFWGLYYKTFYARNLQIFIKS
jgi:hypothetical protein